MFSGALAIRVGCASTTRTGFVESNRTRRHCVAYRIKMYELIKMGGKFAVKSTTGPNKGKLHGITTKPKAEAQKRLLEMIMARGKKK